MNKQDKVLEPTYSLSRTASWVIRDKITKQVIMETFDYKKVNALNTVKYEAIPIGDYLNKINNKIKEKNKLRYQEECTTKENPIRVGTKHIKINGIEFPFIAISDHWRPALVHDSKLVWIHHYKSIRGLRPSVFKIYYAINKVPYNRLPWTVDNECDGVEYRTLIEAISAALPVVQKKEVDIQRSNAASMLGKMGGLVRSEDKTLAARENGKRGGRIGVGSKLKLD